jgi:hypothetical protein
MKHFLAPMLILAGLAMAGCSAPGETYGRPGPAPETSRTFQSDPRSVYDAALVSLAKMEFRVTKGGPAQGKIEAVSGLTERDNLRGSRQISMSIRISALGDGSEVSAMLKEIIEEDSSDRPGFATETKLRDTPYYDVFFNGVTEALAAPKKG